MTTIDFTSTGSFQGSEYKISGVTITGSGDVIDSNRVFCGIGVAGGASVYGPDTLDAGETIIFSFDAGAVTNVSFQNLRTYSNNDSTVVTTVEAFGTDGTSLGAKTLNLLSFESSIDISGLYGGLLISKVQLTPQPDVSRTSGKKRTLPEKCRKCATLSAAQAQALHGAEGNGCWDPTVCYSRSSYAKNRARINQTRSRKRKEGELEQIPVEFEPLIQTMFGVLMVYRKAGVDTPVHAIAADIWQGQEKVAIVPPVHCIGMVPSQVHMYVGKMLSVLEERYNIKKFASQTRLDPDLCPIRPCPLHS